MKKILLITLAILPMLFVSCSGDTPTGVGMNIPEQYRGVWTGALEKVVISANDIEITSSCVGNDVYKLSDYASLDSVVIDQTYDGYKFSVPYSDDWSNNNATEITVSLSGTKDKISLEMIGNDNRKPYIGSIILVPFSETSNQQNLSVPEFLQGSFTGTENEYFMPVAEIDANNISIKTFGYSEPNAEGKWDYAELDFSQQNNLEIIYQNSQEDGVYEIIIFLKQHEKDFRFAWCFEQRSNGFQLRYSEINDLGYSHGGDFFTKTEN